MSHTKKIRILRIINRFNIGGPTYNATFLTRYLDDEFETLLIGGLPDEGESDSLHIVNEYHVKPLLIEEMKRKPSFFSDRKAYRRIKKIMREFQPDIVHTHASKAGALGRRAAINMKVPIIIHTFHGHVFHSYFGRFKTCVYKMIERRLAKKTTGIIAISELQKHELSEQHRICDQSKITVIPLGFDLMKFHQNLDQRRIETRLTFNISEQEIAIAIVGRLAPIKNHQLFLTIIEKVALKTKQKLAVFIVGDGSERAAIEQRIQAMPTIENLRIVMTSWILDMGAFNAGIDIMCLTSDNEGTPVSLIEAQAANIPIVATDVGGVRDVILDGVTGFVVPKNSPDPFVEKLLLLIEDEKIRVKMSQKGWNFVENKFHYSTLADNMKSYYHRLRK